MSAAVVSKRLNRSGTVGWWLPCFGARKFAKTEEEMRTKSIVVIAAIFMIVLMSIAGAKGCQGKFPRVAETYDVAQLWSPLPGAGYLAFEYRLDFVGKDPVDPVPGSISMEPQELGTEEDTGWVDQHGQGYSDYALNTDSHDWAGNKVDFDWVQENRAWEIQHKGKHEPHVGLLTFVIRDAPPYSPHDSAGIPHDHGTLGDKVIGEFGDVVFNRVDVFSVALVKAGGSMEPETDQGVAGEPGTRAATLDYDLWFVDLNTRTSVHGIPERVFVQGWEPTVSFDDYVARWRSAAAGDWNAVAIEPHKGDGRDDTCEIDGVIAALVH